jgi:hypothetical protein
LPYTVDIVDIRTAATGFLAAIARDWTPLPKDDVVRP